MTELAFTLEFLTDLADNNNKAWFDANRARYQQARGAFEQLVADVIANFGEIEALGNTTPKECLFRINRDIRFSKDKSPYNSHMSAAIANGGRQSQGRSYYLQIAPSDSFLGGGMYDPSKEALDNVRQHLAQDAAPLRAILSAPSFVQYFGELAGTTLKTAPAGYDKAHPDIALIRYKQFLAIHKLSDADVTSAGLVTHILKVFAAMKPLIVYLEQASANPPGKN